MKILVSGSTGLVGTSLVARLRAEHHEVVGLVRRVPANDDEAVVAWDPSNGTIEPGELEGFDAVIHLAGENIAARRWSTKQKARIRDSRVEGTSLLARTLAGLESPPATMICASAIGWYGDAGDEWQDESQPPGTGVLPDVCRDWEAAADPAREAGLRVVHARIGVVLAREGGALKAMLLPFRLGLGGRVGSGQQYWSWIALDDLVAALKHLVETDSLQGPVNLVAPAPATNREFTRTLGRVLGRPTIFPMPGVMARLLLGEMANELMLTGARIRSTLLAESGFDFRYPDLESALRHVLDRPAT